MERKHKPGMEIPVQTEEVCQAGKSAWQAKDVMWSEIKVAKYVSHVPRKAATSFICAYRKPTQVDEERILRLTEEALLSELGKMTP